MLLNNCRDNLVIELQNAYVEVTSKCNYSCKYCYNDSTDGNDDYIDLDVYKKFICYMKELGLRQVSISGGEPLLHPEIIEILRYNHSHELTQLLITNASLMSDPLLDELLKMQTISFQLTFDDLDEELHDNMREKDSYRTTHMLIDKLILNGQSHRIFIRYNLTLDNYMNVRNMAEFAYKKGIRNINFAALDGAGRAKLLDSKIIDLVSQRDIIDHIASEVRKFNIEHNGEAKFDQGVIMLGCPYVEGNSINPCITPNGDIYPCQKLCDNNFALGNIHMIKKDELQHEAKEFLKLVHDRIGYVESCSRCFLQSSCRGGCIAMAWANTGDINETDGLCAIRKKAAAQAIREGI